METMQTWSITLHRPSGVISTVETGESQFVIGAETASDVFTVNGEGIAARHAWVWIGEAGLQVEDLGGGTVVNGYQITERVQFDYPASVQLGEVTLVIEFKAVHPVPALQPASSLDAVIPERPVSKSANSLEVTIPHRTKTGAAAASASSLVQSHSVNKAPLTGEYTLVREIARGGMGQIYFGEDPQLERQVAVKVSSVSEDGQDPRFSKEAKVLAQLAHPNIVPIHNFGVDSQGRPFYAMKLVKGRTLQAVLNLIRDADSSAILNYPRATLLTIFRKVCDAMMFAHSKGILHRDLKPENIMVGEYGEVLVMDWGLAKVLGEREDNGSGKSQVTDTGDYGMTMEGEVMGTPQYMSPEQAAGMVAELDQRSDIYSLGGILYAILTLRPPIEGTTLDEVLTKVKHGSVSSMVAKRGGKNSAKSNASSAMSCEVPEALQAVTLKAMSVERNDRYSSVELFAADIERYQNGFATSAEVAGAFKQIKLWIGRNKVLAASAVVLVVVASGLTGRIIAEGRRASLALEQLKATAPTYAMRAQDLLNSGDFEEALKSVEFAINLEPKNSAFHELRGNALQVLMRWSDAVEAYEHSVSLGAGDGASKSLERTKVLIKKATSVGEAQAKADLFAALNSEGRQYEALAFAKGLGEFWEDRKKDKSVVADLVKSLESKLLPVPGTGISMSKTELTVGEWKLYLKAEGYPDWRQPAADWQQTDEHPVVKVSWNWAKGLCEWLSAATGKEWRLPTNAEWEAAVGPSVYPWGDEFPPTADDGNYQINANGRVDPKGAGVDGIRGTAPVGSFKPNRLGFYDLGGNVAEWMWDGSDQRTGNPTARGGGWDFPADSLRSSYRGNFLNADTFRVGTGLRLVRK